MPYSSQAIPGTGFSVARFKTAPALLVMVVCWAVLFLSAGVGIAQTKPQTKEEKVESRKKLSGGLLREPPAPASCAQQQGNLINMLVLGDSILWGQGLKEENKISFRVQDWLCKQMRRPVRVWREAHSGAVLKEGEPTALAEADATKGADATRVQQVSYIDKETGAHEETSSTKMVYEIKKSDVSHGYVGDSAEFNGEINVGSPTIPEQLNHALTHFKGPEVDLVLMDGCINDFGFENFINPSMTTEQIDRRAYAVCYGRMKPMLDAVAIHFPNARIIVTAYYPVITNRSAKNVFFRFVFGKFFSKEKQKWFFPNAKKELFQKLIALSNQWTESSNTSLRRSVNEANEKANNRIAFAPINYKPDSGFGSMGSGFAAPKNTTLLWTSLFNSTGRGGLSKFLYVLFVLNFHPLRPNDEVSSNRTAACKDAAFDFYATTKCKLAAYGHPNKKGVSEYVESVIRELRQLMERTEWLRTATASPGNR